MIISLPKDLIQIGRKVKPMSTTFRFCQKISRLSVPRNIRETFPDLGVDMFVSPSEKALFLTFEKKDKVQFSVNQKTGYVTCRQLFVWAANAGVPLFEDCEYSDYEVDKKNKVVKVQLERK